MDISFGEGRVCLDWKSGVMSSLTYKGREMLSYRQHPIFTMRLRDTDGNMLILNPAGAQVVEKPDGALYDFRNGISVQIHANVRSDQLVWKASWITPEHMTAEYLDFPALTVSGKLLKNGGDGSVLWSYNEGGLVEDGTLKPEMVDPEYPSMGGYSMFPYMLCAQFTAYMFCGSGLYMGVHDVQRAPKGLDFACHEDSIEFRNRLFLGGDNATPEIIWQFFQGDWMDAADIYREWFETNLPSALQKVSENPNLPTWYREMPIVITYPVRGIHDMDEMKPNKFFPYGNALPVIDEFAEKMHSKIMVLLMHWEGTAPWAPPIVWPPYGGEEMFKKFMDDLHDKGHLLGVYCSGLGWTEQSNLIAEYCTNDRIEREKLQGAMCLAPDGSLPHSRICTGQRSGYDICPASKKGKALLAEAFDPLFAAEPDYIQAMDQNHGGSMYFCYSRDHGHPPVPGAWMTRTMQDMMATWKKACPNTLLGCESAAAEPYMEWLTLSDNRYELNYRYGIAVPLYSWLFHPYLHNFMGNQVAAPFTYDTQGINYRLAYSFLAGDLLTLVLNDEGEIMFHWGMRDFSHHSDKDQILTFCEHLHQFQLKYRSYFSDGTMIRPQKWECAEIEIGLSEGLSPVHEKSVLSCAWRNPDNEEMQFFVNYTDKPVSVNIGGLTLTVPALDVVARFLKNGMISCRLLKEGL